MRIDSHMHVWSYEGVEYYEDKPLLSYMEEQRLDMSSLISIDPLENEKVRRLVEEFPDKFFGIAHVSRNDLKRSFADLEDGVAKGLYKGIKVLSYQGGFHVDDDIQMEIYQKCLELDIPILFHVGWHNAGSANPAEAASGGNSCRYSCIGTAMEFGNVLETFPSLKVVFAHMGGEQYFRCMGIAQRFENVYMDTAWLEHYGSSMLPQIAVTQWLEHACRYLGAEKILFGGEYTLPCEIEACGISQDEKDMLLGKNCQRLYKL